MTSSNRANSTSTWNTLRVPFTETMGRVGGGSLTLRGQGSLANLFELSLVGRRWQAFDFNAETKGDVQADQLHADGPA